MIKNKWFFLVLLISLLFGFVSASFAQTTTLPLTDSSLVAPEVPLKAVAGEDKNIIVGRQTLFSASASTSPAPLDTLYTWDFGDGTTTVTGEEVIHTYKLPGVYRGKLTLRYSGQESSDEILISVDKDIILLISDSSVEINLVADLQRQATTQNILLVNLQVKEESLDYLEEAALVQIIIENKDLIKQSKNIIVWTGHSIGMNSLIAASQEMAKTASLESLGFQNKNIIVLTDQSLSATSRIAQNVFNLLSPQYVVLTNTDAKNLVVTKLDINEVITSLKDQNIEYQLLGVHTKRPLDSLKPWNFLSYFVSYLVNNGVPLNTLYFLLILPLIATIVAFARQVVGVKAFGIYAPSLVAVSFLATGLGYGLLVFLLVLGIGTLGRLAARKIKLMYMPRMAIVLSIVSFSILGLLFAGIIFNQTGLLLVSVFPVLIMVIITEKFLSAQIEQGNRAAFTLVGETLFLSIVCYFLANWQSLRVLILGYPEVILGTFVINYLLGKWSGLRLLEYYRFRKVIQNVELSEKK